MASESTPAIEVTGLTKRYGDRVVVDDIDFTVAAGRVTALVGPNGCGKTTTMAMILGLVRPTSGRIVVLGAPLGVAPADQIGALINAPAFYPYHDARTNLRILATLAGAGPSRVDAALAEVGLAQHAGERVGRFSLGMRQRLGVASALLTEPALLVLDEPGNGLDPAGARQLRTLLRSYADSGRAVLVSSHLLRELDDISDDVVLMNGGRVHRQGPRVELLGNESGEVLIAVRATDRARLLELLTEHGCAARPDGRYVRVIAEPERAAAVNAMVVAAGIEVNELRVERASLAGLFDAMVGEAVR